MSEEKQQNPIVAFRHEAEKMSDQFRAALPAHIPVERFQRVLMTAIQSNPKLLRCDRRSLWNSAIKCAQDGLLPDGREAAIVEYRDRDRGEIAQYLPMIAGLRKKVRNSGEIATWDVHAAYEKDEFEFELGDEPFIRHKPSLGDRGRLIAVYSIATLKSGEKSRDVMSVAEVEKIRAISRAKNGPWGNPTFYPEMAKKTVARRSLMAVDWLTRVYTPACLRLAGLTASADALAGLPELTSLSQVPSFQEPIEAARAAWVTIQAARAKKSEAAAEAAAWAAGGAVWAAAKAVFRDAGTESAEVAAAAVARHAVAVAMATTKPTRDLLIASAAEMVVRMCDAQEPADRR